MSHEHSAPDSAGHDSHTSRLFSRRKLGIFGAITLAASSLLSASATAAPQPKPQPGVERGVAQFGRPLSPLETELTQAFLPGAKLVAPYVMQGVGYTREINGKPVNYETVGVTLHAPINPAVAKDYSRPPYSYDGPWVIGGRRADGTAPRPSIGWATPMDPNAHPAERLAGITLSMDDFQGQKETTDQVGVYTVVDGITGGGTQDETYLRYLGTVDVTGAGGHITSVKLDSNRDATLPLDQYKSEPVIGQ